MSVTSTRTVPDFFLAGQPKSGTTALYEMLAQHPDVFVPRAKEPEYFAFDLRRRFLSPMAGNPPTRLQDYLALFAGARPDQTVGEGSTAYVLSEVAAGRIADHNPSARIIVIFREPAAFLRSFHLQLVQNHQENVRDLGKALALEDARRAGRRIPRRCTRPQYLAYSRHVRYTEQLRRWHAAFRPEQVLVLVYEEYRRDNEGTVRRVFEFLGLDPDVPLQPSAANPSVVLRSQVLDDTWHRVTVGRGAPSRALKAGVKAVVPAAVRRRALRDVQTRVLHGPPPPPDEAFLTGLRRRLRPEVESFSDYLGRDLVAEWGYEGL